MQNNPSTAPVRPETAVKNRYAAAAKATEAALCCPVEYNRDLLKIIPQEVIEKDYGCGDPSRYLKPGETVLDLGSGTGKICFIAAQVVGVKGRVIGVDMTDDMLEVARRNAPIVAERLGFANVEFRKGRIQDLALDLEKLTEAGFLKAFADAGFYGIQILKRDFQPWRRVKGIEFRSVTVEAFKGKQGHCFERNQAVIYRGPFKEVLDDDGHRLERGIRHAVCDKTYNLYKKEPYDSFFEFVDPLMDIPLAQAKPFDCSRSAPRHPRETKGQGYQATTESSQCRDGCC